MASIARTPVEIPSSDPWAVLARQAAAWAADHDVQLRDAIVLLPFAQHLPLLRRAWARAGSWMPRIETTLTLARALGPPPAPDAAQLSFDAALDRVAARRLLRSQPSIVAWQRRDPRAFDHAVNAVVQTAHGIARAAAALPPVQREAHWQRGRALLGAVAGPGGHERLLARIALEWAAASGPPATDRLFVLRPSAWIAVQAGGQDALAWGLLSQAEASIPVLWLDTDVPADEPFAAIAPHADVRVAVCADFEAEAQRSAAQVLAHLAAGNTPVALIAQDRLLVRRVRALLARQRVPVLDETGWKLSTTRAAASVAGLLRAAAHRAGSDAWLDWLKSCAPHWTRVPQASWAAQQLETALRRKGWATPDAVDAAALPEPAAALWHAAQALVAGWSKEPRELSGWLVALRAALAASGAGPRLQGDDAGRQVLAALHLDAPDAAAHLGADMMTLDEFTRWVDGALEDASFVPQAPAASSGGAPVIITPLERAMLRPFAAVVFAGADEKRLGAAAPAQPLLGDALAGELGLPTAAERRGRETLAFTQLLRLPRITLLRRRDDGGEPLAPSPLLERLALAFAHAGRGALPDAGDPRTTISRPAEPTPRPHPAAPALLPARLSASACEALRACPYRFFALRLLGLREAEELDDTVEKRDYGTWLHAVLHRFHARRAAPAAAADEEAQLHSIAREVQDEMGLDAASFLPFAATFSRFAPRYIAWLHERDRDGAVWLEGERELSARPPAWAGVQMHGIIDRVDSVPGDAGPVTQLIDYKTGSAQALRALVKQPQEDTQLAFYAALMGAQSDAVGDIDALYLPLDDSEGIKPIVHAEVEATARQLVEGIGRDLARLRGGATLPALGEGRACDYCEARGLCRRDHWPAVDERP